MLIRLLQNISEIQLRQDVNPEAVPPPGWAESSISDGTDKVRFKSHLTMYVVVSCWETMLTVTGCRRADCIIGRALGDYEGG
jgi:hypothetical protein